MKSCNGGEEAMEGQIQTEGKFFVSVRVRPLNDKEVARNEEFDWDCINDKTIMYKHTAFCPDRSTYPSSYTFDRVFEPNSSNRLVYEEGSKAIALSAVSGINASIFTYGQTSSGKTYTMSGITEYAMADIFDYIHKHNERDYDLKFSAIEIYNESVRDLLSLDASPLRLRDDPERGIVVDKLTEEAVRSWNHLQQLLSVCKAQRQIGETLLNETSSRSHQIIRLTVESYVREASGIDSFGALVANVNFIDLGGSERASQVDGSRLKEGSHINRSLLALSTVIRKLSKGRNGHVPYRDSKLTRILQSSLGGNTRIAIICTMSPARSYVEQSRNTLLFGTSAKQVTTTPKVNYEVSDKAVVKQLQRRLSDVTSSYSSDTASLLREKDLLIQKLERQVRELTMQRDIALSHVNDVQQLEVEEEKLPVVQHPVNLPYPKLHVRRQSLGSQTSQASSVVDRPSIDSSSVTRESSQRCSFDESSVFSDCDDDLYPRLAAPPTSVGTSYDVLPRVFVRSPVRQADKSTEELNIKVRCVETEPNRTTSTEPQMQDREFSPSLNQNQDVNEEENADCSPSLQPEVEKVEILVDQSTSSLGADQDSAKKLEDEHMMLYGPGNDAMDDIKSDEILSSYPGTGSLRRNQTMGAKISTEKGILNEDSQVSDIKDATDCIKETGDFMDKSLSTKTDSSIKIVKDIGFQSNLDTVQWPSDFSSLQREVLDLWAICNVSLLYRTSFFLLFEGAPEDCIYMEVERRRLSFIKGAFAWGSETTALDGQIVSPSLSKKHMQQERSMLSKLLKSRISKVDREVLYVDWGVHLDTKKRSSQLANQLWTKPSEMSHVQESARVVSMLIKFDKSHIRKEMFGLNLMPALKGAGSLGWLHSATVLF